VKHALIAATPSIVGFLLAAALATSPRAAERRSFIIPPADGYGIGDCLAEGGSCGRLVADSWCEAHGMASAETFGRADDVTASIAVGGGKGESPQPGSFIINCRE
jgi:hypothetical protein